MDSTISASTSPDFLRVYLGYHMLHMFEQNNFAGEKSWAAFWNKYLVRKWFDAAQASLLAVLDNTYDAPQKSKFLKMLVDFQAYRYEFVELGLIGVHELCEIPYPEKGEFLGLILNQYAFLYEWASRTEQDRDDSRAKVYCIPAGGIREPRRDSLVNTDAFIDDILTKHSTASYILIGNTLVRKKSFDNATKGPYYYLLKQYYLKNNVSALQNVQFQNDDADVTLNAFNLWHLVVANVEAWEPFENHFYDSDVQLDEMEKLIASLKQLDKGLCLQQINSLYMKYHLKMLYYLERYAEPGNPRHTKYADGAMKFISSYYKSRVRDLNPKLSLHIIRQLNLFNWLPGTQSGAWYGYDLLLTISKERILSEDEFRIFAHYLKIFNPQMKKISPVMINKEKVLAVWNEGF